LSLAPLLAVILSASTLLFFLTLNPVSALIGAVCIPIIALASTIPGERPPVTCSRVVTPTRAGRGEPITITLTFESDQPFTAEVLDDLPEPFRVVEGSRHFLLTLGAHSRKSVSYVVVGDRLGHYMLDRVRLRSVEPIRLWHWEATLSAQHPVTLVPAIERAPRVGRLPRSRILEAGPIPSRVAGLGVEFYSLREYQPSDDYRTIFWKGYAKTGKLYSRLHEAERILNVFLLIDGTASARRYLEDVIVVTSNLAHALLAAGVRVGMLAFSRHYALLQPDTGILQLKKVVDQSLGLRAEDPYVFEYQLWMARRLLRRGSLAILVSPLLYEPLVKAAVELAHEGNRILVVALEPREAGDGSLEERVEGLERRNSMLLLAKHGVPYVTWRPGLLVGPLLQALSRWWP
jgi:uncharacterized protein (DUF58 family)